MTRLNTEHNGPKRGKGIGRKAWVKQASRKRRRQTDRGVVSDFPPLKGTGGGSIVRKISQLALIL
jgi:hypothetical protein